jgi:hypothetical protein
MLIDHRIINALSLSGTTLDALGGLYLAYDLFGARYGPLRVLTRLVTYSALCAACFWPLLGFWFGAIGAAVLGPLLALEYTRHGKRGSESRGEALTFQAMRAVGLGLAGWLTIDLRFGFSFGLASMVALAALYEFGNSPAQTYRSGRSPRIGARTVFSAAARGVAIGLAGLLGGALAHEEGALAFGLEIGLVVGTLNALTLTVGPIIEWWAENLSDRSLGGIGAMLAVIGFILQSLQYALPLVGFGQ